NAKPVAEIANSRKMERVMKGGQSVRLGCTANYRRPRNPVAIIPRIPEPEISAVTPAIIQGNREVEITVHGVGFVGNSIVRAGDSAVPTTFVNIRTLRAKIPEQNGAQALKVSVFNSPPDGGISSTVLLKYGAGDAGKSTAS